MHPVVVLGAGKIGRLVTHLLGSCGDYDVLVGDADAGAAKAAAAGVPHARGRRVDFRRDADVDKALEGRAAVVSCAPFSCNVAIAKRARAAGAHYFDLTEDVAVTRAVMDLARGAGSAFMPQCGLAPGFITILGNHLTRGFDALHDVRVRVGALPRFPSNSLKYNLTWSTDGLVNEYLNPCDALVDGKVVALQPLEGLEHLTLDGVEYEAFNTSGGLGTFAEHLAGRARNADYKTLRFPGHATLMRFLLRELRLGEDDRREMAKAILEHALPATDQDQVVVYATVTGEAAGRFLQRTWTRTILHGERDGKPWTAIQLTTASGVCAALDLQFQGKLPKKGFVHQHQIPLDAFLSNRFGAVYA